MSVHNTLDGPTFKLFVEDLKNGKHNADATWNLTLNSPNLKKKRLPNVTNVWLQGYIDSLPNDNDVLTLCDGTGKVNILKSSSVSGDHSWVAEGVYCCILGHVVKIDPVPEVVAYKFICLNDNPTYAQMWPLEVEEFKLTFSTD